MIHEFIALDTAKVAINNRFCMAVKKVLYAV
jgi:hypothetical protein